MNLVCCRSCTVDVWRQWTSALLVAAVVAIGTSPPAVAADGPDGQESTVDSTSNADKDSGDFDPYVGIRGLLPFSLGLEIGTNIHVSRSGAVTLRLEGKTRLSGTVSSSALIGYRLQTSSDDTLWYIGPEVGGVEVDRGGEGARSGFVVGGGAGAERHSDNGLVLGANIRMHYSPDVSLTQLIPFGVTIGYGF